MRGGEVDAIYPSPRTALAQLKGQPGLTYSSVPGFTRSTSTSRFGPKGNPLLQAPWMRQAITLGIDRHSIIKALYGTIAPATLKPLNNLEYEIGTNAIPHFAKWNCGTGQGACTAEVALHRWPVRARPEQHRDLDVRRPEGGVPLRERRPATQRRATSAAIFSQQLGAIGIKLDVQFEPANPNFFGQTGSRSSDFDLAEYAWVAWPDPSGFDADLWSAAATRTT